MLCIVFLIIFMLNFIFWNGFVMVKSFGVRIFLNLGELSLLIVLLNMFLWIGCKVCFEIKGNGFKLFFLNSNCRKNIVLDMVVIMKLV